ncbi:MAG: type II and III secretion system protein family protein [Phycisphaerales bacterium]|nr:type II and III secretion system protein family protein [Phycisphaerales bacterium]
MTQQKHNSTQMNRPGVYKALAIIGGASLAILLSVRASTGQDAAINASGSADSGLVHKGADANGAVRVMLNKSQVLQTRVPYKRISVAQPEIADVNPLGPTTLLVTGKKVGATQIIVWDDQDRNQVMDVVIGFDLAELQEQLNKSFPGAKIEASTTGDNVLLKGRVPNLQVSEQAKMLASGYSDKVMDFTEISGGQQVMLQVKFAEVSKSAADALGVNLGFSDGTAIFGMNNGAGTGMGFNSTGNGITTPEAVGPANIFGRAVSGNSAFLFMVQALRQNNLLRVLAEPNLVTLSGKKASFLAGGEFPIPVPQDGGNGSTTITIEYKEFGVRLNFIPTVLGNGRIRLEVAPEVSELDFTNAVFFNGFRIPALTTRNVNTTVELVEGQTLAIAGLMNNRVTANKDSVPLLGELPVLGALFRSTRYERRETELVVLVSPVLVEGMNPSQVGKLPGQDWRHPDLASQFLLADIGGEQPDPAKGQPAPRYQGQSGFVPAEESVDQP